MIESSDPEKTHTFDVPGVRVYCVDGRDGPLAIYDAIEDTEWIGAERPCNLREWA